MLVGDTSPQLGGNFVTFLWCKQPLQNGMLVIVRLDSTGMTDAKPTVCWRWSADLQIVSRW